MDGLLFKNNRNIYHNRIKKCYTQKIYFKWYNLCQKEPSLLTQWINILKKNKQTDGKPSVDEVASLSGVKTSDIQEFTEVIKGELRDVPDATIYKSENEQKL